MTSKPRERIRWMLFALAFVALTAVGIAWALNRADVGISDLRAALHLDGRLLGLVIMLSLLVYVTDVWRYQALGRAIGERVSWRAGLDASVANFFFSWITPGSSFGAPATIYMLGRRGIAWDAAAIIAFGKSLTGIAILLALAAGVLLAGLGPPFDRTLLLAVVPGTLLVATLLGLLVVAALIPAASTRAVAEPLRRLGQARGPRIRRLLEKLSSATASAIERLAALRRGGPVPLLFLLATHLLYFAAFIGVAAVLAAGFGAGLPQATGISTVYVAFTYVAPTPGGAGLSEAAALPFYGGVLTAESAVVTVLLFRAVTFYLQVVFGLVYLSIAGSLGGVAHARR